MAESSNIKGPEITPELLKNTHAIAAQAALRAQQMLHRSNSEQKPPEVPARGIDNGQRPPPEIPPKRHSLKMNHNQMPGEQPIKKIPPPIPQKPSSAQNSPQMMPKLKENKIINSPQLNARNPTASPLLQQKFQDKIPNSPQLSIRSQNSPQLSQRSSVTNSPQMNIKVKKTISPNEDLGSEDALRGIESGLRNMERAMQEQINLRSLEANQMENINFNPLEFKQNLRSTGSFTSLDTGSQQNLRGMENFRLNLESHMRSLERGFSMDQMRLENLHHVPNMRSMESNPNIRSSMDGSIKFQMEQQQPQQQHNPRPIENHMRSLDRNLPLELQYSRHRAREVVDFRDSLRQAEQQQQQQQQNPLNRGQGPVQQNGGNGMNVRSDGLSREDLRMRRRSSHDETQMAQQMPPGNCSVFCVSFMFIC